MHPALAFVGEQPGDQEDVEGRPFVGPAGQLLTRAMDEAGIDRAKSYLTNAVKHFKYEQRGKRRTPPEADHGRGKALSLVAAEGAGDRAAEARRRSGRHGGAGAHRQAAFGDEGAGPACARRVSRLCHRAPVVSAAHPRCRLPRRQPIATSSPTCARRARSPPSFRVACCVRARDVACLRQATREPKTWH